MKILKPRQKHEATTYSLFFEYKDMPGAGYAFDCDEEGNVNPSNPKENYIKCISGEIEVNPGRIEVYNYNWVEPAIGECECGEEVVLKGFTNTCEACQRDYNMSGSLLGPRDNWGTETGESLSDILRIK